MLTAKTRLTILLVGSLIFLGGYGINQLLIITDSALNPTDINLYQTSTKIVYTWENGTLGHSSSLTLDIYAGSSTNYTTVYATLGDTSITYQCDYDSGEFIANGEKSGNYTIFWIPVGNPMLNAWDFKLFESTSVIDPVGIIGPVNASYTLVIGEEKVWWDTPPEMDGAQFSFVIDIYDENNVKVAQGLMDSTCGLLEILEGTNNPDQLSLLSPGEFFVSRNRWNMLIWVPLLSIISVVVSFIYMKKKNVDKAVIEEVMLLLGVAISVNMVDIIIDVWFYARFGQEIMIWMHLGFFALFALISLRLYNEIKWALPAFLEVAFVFAMTRFVGDPYVPHMTAFMGMYCAYLAMLFRSGYPKREGKDKLSLIV